MLKQKDELQQLFLTYKQTNYKNTLVQKFIYIKSNDTQTLLGGNTLFDTHTKI